MCLCVCMYAYVHVCACVNVYMYTFIYPSRIYRIMDVIVVEWLWMPACIDVVIIKDEHVIV